MRHIEDMKDKIQEKIDELHNMFKKNIEKKPDLNFLIENDQKSCSVIGRKDKISILFPDDNIIEDYIKKIHEVENLLKICIFLVG